MKGRPAYVSSSDVFVDRYTREPGHPYRPTRVRRRVPLYTLIGTNSIICYNEWLLKGERTTLGRIVFRQELTRHEE